MAFWLFIYVCFVPCVSSKNACIIHDILFTTALVFRLVWPCIVHPQFLLIVLLVCMFLTSFLHAQLFCAFLSSFLMLVVLSFNLMNWNDWLTLSAISIVHSYMDCDIIYMWHDWFCKLEKNSDLLRMSTIIFPHSECIVTLWSSIKTLFLCHFFHVKDYSLLDPDFNFIMLLPFVIEVVLFP